MAPVRTAKRTIPDDGLQIGVRKTGRSQSAKDEWPRANSQQLRVNSCLSKMLKDGLGLSFGHHCR
jgi:hypothetical protein